MSLGWLIVGIVLLMVAASVATMGCMYLFRDDVQRLYEKRQQRPTSGGPK